MRFIFNKLIIFVFLFCGINFVFSDLIITNKTTYHAGFCFSYVNMKVKRSDKSIDLIESSSVETSILDGKKFNKEGLSFGVNFASMIPLNENLFIRPCLTLSYEGINSNLNKKKYYNVKKRTSSHNLIASINQKYSGSFVISLGSYISNKSYYYFGLGPHVSRIKENFVNNTVDKGKVTIQTITGGIVPVVGDGGGGGGIIIHTITTIDPDIFYLSRHSVKRSIIRLKYLIGYGYRVSERLTFNLEGYFIHKKTISNRYKKIIGVNNSENGHEVHCKYNLHNIGFSVGFSILI